jgi:hypothetical protein
VIFEPLELLEKLAALVPEPQLNLVRYFGVLGASAGWRPMVIPAELAIDGLASSLCAYDKNRVSASRQSCIHPRRYSWAELLKRVFECPINWTSFFSNLDVCIIASAQNLRQYKFSQRGLVHLQYKCAPMRPKFLFKSLNPRLKYHRIR